jgi:hypothetical protein
MTNLLILSASPQDVVPLQVNAEVSAIKKRLSLAGVTWLELVHEGAVRATELSTLLLQHEPEILHFSGHGTGDGGVCLQDDNGAAVLVEPQILKKVLQEACPNIRLVVLNACYSDAQASAIAECVPFVVGMKKAIGDAAAIAFSAGFYQALAFGRSLAKAHALALLEVELHGGDAGGLSVIRSGVESDPKEFYPLPRPEIYADLQRENGRICRNESEYGIYLHVRNAPTGTLEVVYLLNDESFGGKPFIRVRPDGMDFAGELWSYGDLEIRAALWYKNGGLCLVTKLTTALRRFYGANPDATIDRAIRRIEES